MTISLYLDVPGNTTKEPADVFADPKISDRPLTLTYVGHENSILEKDAIEAMILTVMLVIATARLGLRFLKISTRSVLTLLGDNIGEACAMGYLILVLYMLGGAFRQELLESFQEALTVQFGETFLNWDAITTLSIGCFVAWLYTDESLSSL